MGKGTPDFYNTTPYKQVGGISVVNYEENPCLEKDNILIDINNRGSLNGGHIYLWHDDNLSKMQVVCFIDGVKIVDLTGGGFKRYFLSYSGLKPFQLVSYNTFTKEMVLNIIDDLIFYEQMKITITVTDFPAHASAIMSHVSYSLLL
jgi:hypothetical protein